MIKQPLKVSRKNIVLLVMLFVFIIVTCWNFFSKPPDINGSLSNPLNIQSIKICRDSCLIINDTKTIDTFCRKLKGSISVNVENKRIDTSDLNIYIITKNKNEINIMLDLTQSRGALISKDDWYYKNDSLCQFVLTYYRRHK